MVPGVQPTPLRLHSTAAVVLRALVASGFEAETIEVVPTFVGNGLEEYNRKKSDEESWKIKGESVYFLKVVATVGATVQQGGTSALVVQFFLQHVYVDLQADENSVHPILQVDAIRYLYSFRNQLIKEQSLSVIPLLVRHLRSPNYVCYTYAATTIERILFIKRGSSLLFNQKDIRELAPEIIDTLMPKIGGWDTGENCGKRSIHSVYLPNPFADARTPRRRRSSRLSFHPTFPPPARFLGAKDLHSCSRPHPTCLPCMGCRANGTDRPVHRYSGRRATETDSIACQRCVGLRAAAERREVYIPSAWLKSLMKSVVTMLLSRLQTARTDGYVCALGYFFTFIMAIPVDGVGSDFLISSVGEVQHQLWSQLLANVVLPQIPKMLPKDRKVVIVCVARMLTQSSLMVSEPSVRQWPAAFSELVKLFSATTHLKSVQQTVVENPDEALYALDFEEQGAEYQAAETITEGPVAYIGADVWLYVGQQLSSVSKNDTRIKLLIGMADTSAAVPFI